MLKSPKLILFAGQYLYEHIHFKRAISILRILARVYGGLIVTTIPTFSHPNLILGFFKKCPMRAYIDSDNVRSIVSLKDKYSRLTELRLNINDPKIKIHISTHK